jgi:hypothetical protein
VAFHPVGFNGVGDTVSALHALAALGYSSGGWRSGFLPVKSTFGKLILSSPDELESFFYLDSRHLTAGRPGSNRF